MMSLADILHHRRAVREYLPTPIETDTVKSCLQLACLAPTSSNMQLYELYHISDKRTLDMLAKACLSQRSALTANQMVVFVVRPDKHREHAQAVLEFEQQNIQNHAPKDKIAKRLKAVEHYYHHLMPLLYSQNVPLLGQARGMLASAIGKFRPMQKDISPSDIRISLHKSCGLVAQTFMLAMSEQGLDTCPMEGFDGDMIKTLLRLPPMCEINMVVSCGIRSEAGVWGERFRMPFEQIYRHI